MLGTVLPSCIRGNSCQKERQVTMTRLTSGTALVVSLVLLSGVAAAQETTGTLSGRLVDAQGLALPGATVTVTGPQGARSVVTDEQGRFQSPFLTPGVYDVRAELQGFKAV